MQLKTSFFNFTLFQKNLTRFWPMWALYGLFWFLCLPATMFRRIPYIEEGRYFEQVITSLAAQPGVIVAFFFGVLCAMALFSYLCQHRSAVAMHAFPLRRECLFFTNYLSGLAFFAIPLCVNFVLVLLVELLAGWVNIGTLLMWLTAQLCYALFFYSFAVFCVMFTGNLLALPAFYGILSILPVALAYLIDSVMHLFVFGYSTSYTMEQVSLVLSPVVKLCSEVSAQVRSLPEGELYYISGWGWIALYALVGLALAVAALLVYRRRQVETAGDVVSVRVVRPIFLYGVSTCVSLTFGLFLFALFGDSTSTTVAWQLLAFMLISGFLGYFAARMLLNKTLRVWRGYWKGFVAFSAAVALVIAAMEFDVFGFERSVPQAENVVAVEIAGSSYPPYDGRQDFVYTQSEEIAQVVALNQTIVEQRDVIQREMSIPYEGYAVDVAYGEDGTEYYPADRIVYLNLIYTMKNGSTQTRSYQIWMQETDLADPESIESQLQALLNQTDRANGFFGSYTQEDVTNADVRTWDDWAELTGDEAQLLFQAVREDLSAGRIGRVWLMESRDYQEIQLDSQITFTFRRANANGGYNYYGYDIVPTRDSTSTIAALRELGIDILASVDE